MAKRKPAKGKRINIADVQLIKNVERIKPDNTGKCVEGLMLRVCTRIKNHTPFPKDNKCYASSWRFVIVEAARRWKKVRKV